MAEISRITLPSGNTYDLKDAVARQMIAGGISFILAYTGGTPVVANIPAGVVIKYQGTDYVGTLVASADTVAKFYLIKSTTQVETLDVYDEYVTIQDGNTYFWEKIGDTALDIGNLGQLAYKDSVTLQKGSGANVLGSGSTFTASSSSVSFTGGTTDKVLGSDATFTTAVTASVTNIKATATGAAVGADGTDSFIKSYAGATSKLVTASIPNVTGNADVTIPNVTGNANVNIPNVTNVGSASTWAFVLGTGTDAETLIITGSNSVAPTLGTALIASKVTLGTALTASKVTLGTEIKAATGELNNNGGGASIMTGLGAATTASALTGVKVTAQPTISLATGATAGTGVISVATGISGASTAVSNKDEVTAVTGIGTGTAAAQTITVGNNDIVKVAKYGDLGVSAQ